MKVFECVSTSLLIGVNGLDLARERMAQEMRASCLIDVIDVSFSLCCFFLDLVPRHPSHLPTHHYTRAEHQFGTMSIKYWEALPYK